jgi:SAM-dependent methyltransferase
VTEPDLASECPCCGHTQLKVFYSIEAVPVHDVQLHYSRADALGCATGDLKISHCAACGFIWNAAYRAELLDYTHEYESTQACSDTFNLFHERLARDLIDRFDLRGRTVLEVGCGQGEFLELLCHIGGNRGIGFDPAYRGETEAGPITFFPEFYSEAHRDLAADFLCCKMTLEHIPGPAGLLKTIRQAVDSRTTVFFQVPDVRRILQERAFWDIYYEHCNYFSAASLAGVFRRNRFDVVDVWRDYGDQYLMIEARPGTGRTPRLPAEETPAALEAQVNAFAADVADHLAGWRQRIQQATAEGRRVFLWGGGSKAVAFLTATGAADHVPYVVDVNPNKKGTFLAGTGVEVISPDSLDLNRPDIVVAMNPIYRDEIAAELESRGVPATVEALGVPNGQSP